MVMDQDPESVNRRIARLRKKSGLTQQELADRTQLHGGYGYSRSHLAQVERGHKMATPAFVSSVAAALGIQVADLYGQPYRDTLTDDGITTVIGALREALAYVDVPPELTAPRPLDVLEEELRTVHTLLQQTRHTRLGALLPALVEESTVHALETGSERAWRALHRAHVATIRLTRKLGFEDLAELAAERARASATAAQDPHLAVMVTQRRTLVMMARAQWRPALAALAHAAQRVDHDRADSSEILGAIYLRSAVLAARAGDGPAAESYLAQAEEMDERAERLSHPRDTHATTFTTGNVAVHRAAVSVEVRDYDAALRRDARVVGDVAATLIPERHAHHHIDMARALAEIGKPRVALQRLERAEAIAPQLTMYHPQARLVTQHLVDAQRSLPAPLRRMASRMHVL